MAAKGIDRPRVAPAIASGFGLNETANEWTNADYDRNTSYQTSAPHRTIVEVAVYGRTPEEV